MTMTNRLLSIQQQIVQAAQRYGRRADSISLLAVSKTQLADRIVEAFNAGQRDFGESYMQEAIDKIHTLETYPICWHFIGPIQSNKTKWIAELFQWVHSIDRLKIAERLQAQRSPFLPPLNVCIQVNIDDEETKSGVSTTGVIPLAQNIVGMPNLKLRGLMAIPAPKNTFEEQRESFQKVRALFEQLNCQGFHLDTLSMGMSDDFEAAIAEGATIIRLGSAIFGKRQ